MKRLFTLLIFCIVPFFCIAEENAEALFKKLAPSVYQIKLIDIASGEKSSIGTGFQITADGLLATNYHVISGFARYPEKYQMQYLDSEGKTGELTLKRVDVVNDLALVKRTVDSSMPFFSIAQVAPTRGEELYSLGNPHDLGMIVVPGTYNGLKSDSFNDRIHFTGSVNQGMSGGPVVNQDSQVVGVNVATSGNQIGFLVPHDKLLSLFEKYQNTPPTDIKDQMTEQLTAYQNKLIQSLVNAQWQIKNLDDANVPIIGLPYMRCWGNSNADKKDDLYFTALTSCSLEDDIYIEGEFFTGSIEMHNRFMDAKELTDSKFYRLYAQRIAGVSPNNKATKNHVGEYQCHHDIVNASEQNIKNKAVFCARAYKDFTDLYDVLYLSSSVDKSDKALISLFIIAGVEQKNALAFMKKYMEAVSWKQ
ncbi:MAG: S1 family peptidase [Thalassotalea sp.]